MLCVGWCRGIGVRMYFVFIGYIRLGVYVGVFLRDVIRVLEVSNFVWGVERGYRGGDIGIFGVY